MDILFIIIASILMLVGLAGIILPVLPGLPVVWLGFFIYAIGTGFDNISLTAVIVFGIIVLLTLLIDFLGPFLGLNKYQASKFSYLGAFSGLVIGLIFFGFWGIILGPLLGAFMGELAVKRNFKSGLLAALSAFLGTFLGGILKIAIALMMIGYFIASFF